MSNAPKNASEKAFQEEFVRELENIVGQLLMN